MPIPIAIGSSPRARRRALSGSSRASMPRAQSTARRAWSGPPSDPVKTAQSPSPMNLSRMPPCEKTSATISPRYSLSIATTLSGASSRSRR